MAALAGPSLMFNPRLAHSSGLRLNTAGGGPLLTLGAHQRQCEPGTPRHSCPPW